VRRTGGPEHWQDWAMKLLQPSPAPAAGTGEERQKLPPESGDPQALFWTRWPLTIAALEAYIRPLGTPPLPRRVGVSAKPLTDYSVNEHWAIILMAMFASPCRMGGAPGCLISESEERETWTAGSLRAASSNGEASAFSATGAAVEETSAVLRFRSTL